MDQKTLVSLVRSFRTVISSVGETWLRIFKPQQSEVSNELFMMTILFIFLVTGLANEFKPQCDVSGVASPQHILPRPKEMNFRNLKNFSDYVRTGWIHCERARKDPLHAFLSPIQERIRRLYGVLYVEFGPISDCPTFSRCWFGMLSCGEMKQQPFLQEYEHDLNNHPARDGLEESPYLPFRDMPSFQGWSIQSLNIQFRIVGPEILFPDIVYIPSRNILLCSYTLTVPGTYRIEIIPREFYPGLLFNYTKKEKKEGYDLIGYKPLVTTVKPVITSLPMQSSPVFFCDLPTRQRKDTTPFKLPDKLPTLLPYCSKGNHQGRYLTIPRESLKICEAEKILPLMASLQDDNLTHDLYSTRLESEYIASDHAGHERQLREYLIQQYRNQSQPIEHRLHLQELLRHTDEKSSLCPLIVVNDWPLVRDLLDTRHEIFAPYKCRYKFYSPLQARSCLKSLHRKTSYSIGDSLTRDLFTLINIFLNISHRSLHEMKVLNTEVDPSSHPTCLSSSHSSHSLTYITQIDFSDADFNRTIKRIFFPFTGYSHLPLKKIKPSVFMTGFSWGHFTDLNMTDFRLRVLNSTFFSDLRNEIQPLKRTIKIFESTSFMTRFALESYRRRNAILKEIFVNQLGFQELDQHQLTAGKLDAQDRIHYAGVPRAMSIIISLNLMCKPH